MPEGISNQPDTKGDRHLPPSKTPKEHRGAHSIIKSQSPSALTDLQIEQEFLASFASIPDPIEEINPVMNELGKSEERVIVPPLKSPNRYVLPSGAVFTDEDGAETQILSHPTDVDGYWAPRPNKETGPARFILTALYPNGRQGKRVEIRGQSVIRRGVLWNGQTTKDIKK